MGGATHIPKPTEIRHTHTYVNIHLTTLKVKPTSEGGAAQPHTPPPRVVTKPHIERSDNTYIGAGSPRHTPRTYVWRTGVWCRVFVVIPPLRVNITLSSQPTTPSSRSCKTPHPKNVSTNSIRLSFGLVVGWGVSLGSGGHIRILGVSRFCSYFYF